MYDEYEELREGVRLRNEGQGIYQAAICRTCGDRLPPGTDTHQDCWLQKKLIDDSSLLQSPQDDQ